MFQLMDCLLAEGTIKGQFENVFLACQPFFLKSELSSNYSLDVFCLLRLIIKTPQSIVQQERE